MRHTRRPRLESGTRYPIRSRGVGLRALSGRQKQNTHARTLLYDVNDEEGTVLSLFFFKKEKNRV